MALQTVPVPRGLPGPAWSPIPHQSKVALAGRIQSQVNAQTTWFGNGINQVAESDAPDN